MSKVVDAELVSDEPTSLAKAESSDLATPDSVSMDVLRDLGFITPIASPEHLRAAFAYKQRMFAAILDSNDYLYTVSWQSDGKTTQRVTPNYDEAKAMADKFAHLGSELGAKPKKSGITKLARALGITARRIKQSGLPDDPTATYSFVEYEATHEDTGKTEHGVGWCDKGERGGKISTHDVIATADTRAYNRAVLRLAGFGDVSADEIVAGVSDGADVPVEVPSPPKAKEMDELPDIDDDNVVAACRAWAESFGVRSEGQAPQAKQDTRSARELRANARRGSTRSATKLGALGLRWNGTASDGPGYMTFEVGAPPVTPGDIQRSQKGLEKALAGKTSSEKRGLNLSGNGSDKDDDGLPPDLPDVGKPRKEGAGVPQPSPTAETITTKQAKNISTLLKQIFSNVDEMRTWLREECHIDTTVKMRANQYEPAMRALQSRLKE